MWSPPNDSALPSLRRPNGTCSTSSSGCCGPSGTSPSSDVFWGFGRTAKVELHLDVSQISRPKKKNIQPPYQSKPTVPSIYPDISRHMTYPDPTTNQPPTNHQPTTNQPRLSRPGTGLPWGAARLDPPAAAPRCFGALGGDWHPARRRCRGDRPPVIMELVNWLVVKWWLTGG